MLSLPPLLSRLPPLEDDSPPEPPDELALEPLPDEPPLEEPLSPERPGRQAMLELNRTATRATVREKTKGDCCMGNFSNDVMGRSCGRNGHPKKCDSLLNSSGP